VAKLSAPRSQGVGRLGNDAPLSKAKVTSTARSPVIRQDVSAVSESTLSGAGCRAVRAAPAQVGPVKQTRIRTSVRHTGPACPLAVSPAGSLTHPDTRRPRRLA
jgi:hypothetical protein